MRKFAAHRQKIAPPASGRAPWVKLVEAARTIAARDSGDTFGLGVERAPSTGDLILDVKHLLRRVRAMDFPMPGASSVELADSFLHGLKAFTEAGTPERRSLCAPVLKATAGAVMDMLEDLRAEDARNSWQRRIPENDR